MPRGGGAATQVTQAGGFEAIETLDGKALYFARSRVGKGLWSMPPSGGEAHAVAGLESAAQGNWGVTQDGVCYLGPGQKTRPTSVAGTPRQARRPRWVLSKNPVSTRRRRFPSRAMGGVSCGARSTIWIRTWCW